MECKNTNIVINIINNHFIILSFKFQVAFYLSRLPQIYEEFHHTINNADHQKDLKWWANNHGVNMAMAWPQFEVFALCISYRPLSHLTLPRFRRKWPKIKNNKNFLWWKHSWMTLGFNIDWFQTHKILPFIYWFYIDEAVFSIGHLSTKRGFDLLC